MSAQPAASSSGFSSLLPFKMLNGDGDTVCLRDGGIMACVEFSPPDIIMKSAAEHEALAQQMYREINQCVGRSAGWSVYFDVQRVQVSRYLTTDASVFSGNGIPYWVDVERAAQFSEEPRFVTRFRMSLKLRVRALSKKEDSILNFLSNPHRTDDNGDDEFAGEYQNFDSTVNAFVEGIRKIFLSARRLKHGELMAFLHSTFNPMGAQRVAFSKIGAPLMFLDAELANCSFIADANQPAIVTGGEVFHLGFVSIRNWPHALTPDFQNIINLLSFECRYSVRFTTVPHEKFAVMLSLRRSVLAASAQKIRPSAADQMIGENLDSAAVSKSEDAHLAEQAHKSGVIFGGMNVQFMVWDKDPRKLSQKLGILEETCRRFGYLAKRETFNANFAFIGSLPGEDDENPREDVCSLENAVYSATLTNSWEGIERNMVVPGGAPPLFYGVTTGDTPFMFSTHHSSDPDASGTDSVGHTMIIGQTGGGKSVLEIFMAMQFAKYGGRIIYFDRRRSSMVATLAAGGKFFDFGKFDREGGIGVQPLRDLDTSEQISAADLWIRRLLQDRHSDSISETDLYDIGAALKIMSSHHKKYRTLAVFQTLVQSRPIKRALADYITGSFAGLFNTNKQVETDSFWTTFEIGSVLQNPEISRPLLRFLFTHITGLLDEKPTMICIDEGYDFLSDPFFADKFNEMLRQFRKLNAHVVMATQSIADLVENPKIQHSVANNMLNRIFLPSPEIKREDVRALYRTLELSETHLDILAAARPQRDYFFHTPAGSKLASLDLREMALAFCSASNKRDLAYADRILAENNGEFDVYRWLAYKNVSPDLVSEIKTMEEFR